MVELHIALAIALFFLSNWLGQHSAHVGYMQLSVLAKVDEAPAFNFIYRAFAPIAFITIASAALYAIGADKAVVDIYLVVVYYFALRILFNVVTGKARLLNWSVQIAYLATSIPAAYYVYTNLIVHKQFLFPSSQDLGTAVWLGVAAYIYHTMNSVRTSLQRTEARKLAYLTNRYTTYQSRYGKIIQEIAINKQQEILIMAVLIYEAFNRPHVYRIIENGLFRLGMARTLGIMQVTTDVLITDDESVRLGAQKIFDDHQKALQTLSAKNEQHYSWLVRREVVASYNRDDQYVEEVLGIYKKLINTFAPECKDNYEAEVARYEGSSPA